jgi:multidrug resistance protein MdtO
MVTTAQNLPESSGPSVWFWEFLKEELAPYPGRAALVARMVICATLVMLLTMTFRIPYGMHGAVFTLIISRQSPQATMRAVRTIIITFAFSAVYIFIGALFSLDDPTLRLLWIIGTLVIAFYAISAMTDYVAATGFGILIAITISLWDMHVPAELKVENTLWAFAQTAMACAITLLVELLFAGFRRGDDLRRSIAERLASVGELLDFLAADQPVDNGTNKSLTRLALTGTSRLRQIVQVSAYSLDYREQMEAVVTLVGRLVDIAANLAYFRIQSSDNARKRLGTLSQHIANLRADLLSARIPPRIEFSDSAEVPLLREMEKTVALIPDVFAKANNFSANPTPQSDDSPVRLFARDALSNSDHIKFGLKGCLAASLCYIIYTSLAWPGISTAVVTCILTALTTVGSSRQKQVLRVTGAIVGGVVVGIGSQVFILPYLDSIGGFTLLFIAVTIVAAWFATSSPRLSYFGVQLALAFYVINLQEFKVQTSLTVGRDRVIGILLGLFMMWLVFDQLWGAPAVVGMKRAFISSLRFLAQFAREPVSRDLRVAIERSYSLRETINTNLEKTRTLADAVLFEFGPSRQQDLALRRHIVRWQSELRMLFLMEIAWLKYSLQLPGFELPEELREAQQEFSHTLAHTLEGMADRIEGGPAEENLNFEDAVEYLERKIQSCFSKGSSELLAAHLQTLQSLSSRMGSLTISLANEIQINGFPLKHET